MNTGSALLLTILVLAAAFPHGTESLSMNLTQIGAQAKQYICCETYAPTQTLFYCVYKNSPNFEKVCVSDSRRI
jgi:hypothetical protein